MVRVTEVLSGSATEIRLLPAALKIRLELEFTFCVVAGIVTTGGPLTAVTDMVTDLESVPPDPSLAVIATDADPLYPDEGVKEEPFNALLTLVSVPENVMEASAVPSPDVKVKPDMPESE